MATGRLRVLVHVHGMKSIKPKHLRRIMTKSCSDNVQAQLDAYGNVDLTSVPELESKTRALMDAAREGNIALVRLLCGRMGVNVNEADSTGVTALMSAAREGHLEVVRLLCGELRANVNQADRRGSTALMLAAQGGHLEVVRLLAGSFGGNVNQTSRFEFTVLMDSALGGNSEMVRLLGSLGAKVNQACPSGFTALMLAARNQLEVVRILVKELGAHVNMTSRDGSTALAIATAFKQTAIVKFLTRHGADPTLVPSGTGSLASLARDPNGDKRMGMSSGPHHMGIVSDFTRDNIIPTSPGLSDRYESPTAAMLHGKAAMLHDLLDGLFEIMSGGLPSSKGANPELAAYLESKLQCANPGCSGSGAKKCSRCLQVRYCSPACQKAHWQASHKRDCKKKATKKRIHFAK